MSVLGEGGMGTVWLAEHLALCAPVALKLLRPVEAGDPIARGRFLREARIACALRSPHVVQIFDYGTDHGTAYIAMERLEGEALATRVQRRGSIGRSETVRVITHVARALARAHELGVVHRDLKPDNVFLVDDDEEIVKVLDFGVATQHRVSHDSEPSSALAPAGLMGTPQYMSPEQARCAETVDHRADIWALGVIAFECLIGYPPFAGSTVSRVLRAIQSEPLPLPSQCAAVPRDFDLWFQRACARDPAQRFGSALEAADELDRVLGAPAEELSSAPSLERTSLNVSPRAERAKGGSALRPERRACVLALSAFVISATAVSVALRQYASRSHESARNATAEVPVARCAAARTMPP